MDPDAPATSDHIPFSICTFNVNSLKEVCDRNGFSAGAGEQRVAKLLEQLQCDIVCFQEVKLSQASLKLFHQLSQAPGWDSYFSFARNPPLANFAGVATFCNTKVTAPRAAEEGLLRVLPPQNPAAAAQELAAAAAAAAVGGGGDDGHIALAAAAAAGAAAGLQAWPSDLPFPQQQLQGMFTAAEAAAVDLDGRCVITDHGLFILINVYLPAATGGGADAHGRNKVKMDMIRALDARLRCFLSAGRNVLAVGDFNIAALPEDLMATPHPYHDFADPHLQVRFYRASIPRVWLRSLLAHNPPPPAAAAHGSSSDGSSSSSSEGNQNTSWVPSSFNPGQHLSAVPQLITSHSTGSSSSAEQQQQQQQDHDPAPPLKYGFMIDSLRRLIPEGFARYPDHKKGGFKIRPLFTAWDITRNIRNDEHGGRVDYLLVGDAAAYAASDQQQQQQGGKQRQLIMPAVAAAAAAVARSTQGSSQQQQQQQHGYLSHLNLQIPVSQYLSSAFIDRERRWSDHAAVVLKLLLPPAAAALLLPPHGSSPAAAQNVHLMRPTMNSRYLCDRQLAAAAAASIAAASAACSSNLQAQCSSSKLLGCNIVETLLKPRGVEVEEARVLTKAQALYPTGAGAAAASMTAFCDLYAGPAAAAGGGQGGSSSNADPAAAAAAARDVAFEPFVQRALHNEQVRQLGKAGIMTNQSGSNPSEGLAGLFIQHRRQLDEFRDWQQQQRQQLREVKWQQRKLKRRMVLRSVPAAVAAAAQDQAAAAAAFGGSGSSSISCCKLEVVPVGKVTIAAAAAAAAAVKLEPGVNEQLLCIKREQHTLASTLPHLGITAAAATDTTVDVGISRGVFFEGVQMACTSSEEDE